MTCWAPLRSLASTLTPSRTSPLRRVAAASARFVTNFYGARLTASRHTCLMRTFMTGHTTNAPSASRCTAPRTASANTSIPITKKWKDLTSNSSNTVPRRRSSSRFEGVFYVSLSVLDEESSLLLFDKQLSAHELRHKYSMATAQGFICKLCGKVIKNIIGHLRDRHFHDGITYRCPTCESEYRTKNSLGVHISKYHKDWKGVKLDEFATSPLWNRTAILMI